MFSILLVVRPSALICRLTTKRKQIARTEEQRLRPARPREARPQPGPSRYVMTLLAASASPRRPRRWEHPTVAAASRTPIAGVLIPSCSGVDGCACGGEAVSEARSDVLMTTVENM